MPKKVLFSPVGGTDPISQDNCFDGSMLHVCRHYKPDVVYLYISSEMLKNEENDHRYTLALKLLSEKINHQFEVKLITRPDLKNVHDFNFFYKDFDEEVKSINNTLGEDDELLINISSGTPGMKSALNVMSTFGEFRCKCIQVANPEGKIGEHTHRDKYDLNTLWGLNPDNEDNAKSRCSVVECPNLSLLKSEQTIKSFLKQYDYQAAYSLAKDLERAYSKDAVARYIDYLEFANERSKFKNISSLENKLKDVSGLLPVSSPNRFIFEYALLCDLKWKRGELSDFVRSLSPLIYELFLRIVDKNIYPVSKSLIKDSSSSKSSNDKSGKKTRIDGDSHDVWDRKKMEDLAKVEKIVSDIQLALRDKYDNFDSNAKDPYVYSDSLCTIIGELSDNKEMKDDVRRLRDQIERKIRNLLAHKIVYIDEDWIKRATGNLNEEQIMKLVKKVFRYSDLNIKDNFWNSYDDMNEFIIAKIGKNEEP